jgi:dihydropteroate synthase
MHMQGTPRTMQKDPTYDDVVAEVTAFLRTRVETLTRSGLARETLCADPGIGFGKTLEHNVALLRGLPALTALGLPVLVGLSRKSFLGLITDRPVGERLAATLAALACVVLSGADILRVHDVKECCDATRVAARLRPRG